MIHPEGRRLKYDKNGNVVGDGFAAGGAVMRDAGDEYNPTTIAALADALSKELA